MQVDIKNILNNIRNNIRYIRKNRLDLEQSPAVFQGVQLLRYIEGKKCNSLRAVGLYESLENNFLLQLEKVNRRLNQKVEYIKSKESSQ